MSIKQLFIPAVIADLSVGELFNFFYKYQLATISEIYYIPSEFEGNPVSCLNERLSFLKYSTCEYFRAHEDGYYIRPDNSEMSFIKVQIYLNDLKEEDGGATTFIKDIYNRIYQDYSVIPKVGRVLLFEHNIEHEGSILKNGVKYCIRTDVMYNITKNR